MKSKAAAHSRRHTARTGAKRAGGRKATTFRLDPRLQKGLALLGELRGVPVNRLVNEAVGDYLETRAASVEAELEETLRRVRAYREADPGFESAISTFADADAKSATDDPIEGRTTRAKGPSRRLVRELIRD
jgi:hypothetical protein